GRFLGGEHVVVGGDREGLGGARADVYAEQDGHGRSRGGESGCSRGSCLMKCPRSSPRISGPREERGDSCDFYPKRSMRRSSRSLRSRTGTSSECSCSTSDWTNTRSLTA